MPRKRFVKKDDICPREIDIKKKPAVKLYDEYEEELVREGDFWIIRGWFAGAEYAIPLRTKYTFGAIHHRYRLLLKSEIDKLDPNTGQVFPGENRAAQFEDGHYETRDLFDVRGIYRSDAWLAGRIWDQDTEAAKQRETNYRTFKNMLMKDPEFKERFIAELKGELADDASDELAVGN
jgi:hypothetical protein